MMTTYRKSSQPNSEIQTNSLVILNVLLLFENEACDG